MEFSPFFIGTDWAGGGYMGSLGVEYGNQGDWHNLPLPSFSCQLFNSTSIIDFNFPGSTGMATVRTIDYHNIHPFAMHASDLTVQPPLIVEASNFEAIKDPIYSHLNGSLTLVGHILYRNDPATLDVTLTNLIVYLNGTALIGTPIYPRKLKNYLLILPSLCSLRLRSNRSSTLSTFTI